MFRFFHLCDHVLFNKDTAPHEREITIKTQGTGIDILFDGGIVKSIKSVRAITYTPRVTRDTFLYDNNKDSHTYEDVDEKDGYYDGSNYFYVNYDTYFKPGAVISEPLPTEFYRPFLHNRIKWSVEAPLTYLVEATVQFSTRRTESHTLSDCPQCQGKGWFADILDSKGRFHTDDGVMKIAQRVVKDLLTELQSSVLNLQYGTRIKQTTAGVVKEDEVLFDDIRLIVSEVEDRYLFRQQDEYDSINPDERLVKLWLRSIARSPKDVRRLVMELQIETEEEVKTFRFVL